MPSGAPVITEDTIVELFAVMGKANRIAGEVYALEMRLGRLMETLAPKDLTDEEDDAFWISVHEEIARREAATDA